MSEAKNDINNAIDRLEDLIKIDDVEEIEEVAKEAVAYLKGAIYEVENLERDNEQTSLDLRELESENQNLSFFDKNLMVDQMKIDALEAIWNDITLEDIESLRKK